MPQTVMLGMPFAGYSMESGRLGDSIRVMVRGFVSSEDGLELVEKLDGAPTQLLRLLNPPIPASKVDHMLAYIRRSGEAVVYVNELSGRAHTRIAKKIEPGQPVLADDIVEIKSLDLGVEIPSECGVVFVTSVGWRKAYYFDFAPLGEEMAPRDYDLSEVFGQVHAYLVFQDRCSISESEWDDLFKKNWFPFIGLPAETVRTMLKILRAGDDIDTMIDDVSGIVTAKIEEWRDAWNSHGSFADHQEILNRAIERYLERDYISCSALVYTRIEGLIRSFRREAGAQGVASQKGLSSAAVPAAGSTLFSPMLSGKFRDYLEDVYFGSFDPDADGLPANRNTVGHGVVSPSNLSKKSSTIGLLVVRQLFFAFEVPK